jgi:meiotically up-regulated gene 157 (Mug157) protein
MVKKASRREVLAGFGAAAAVAALSGGSWAAGQEVSVPAGRPKVADRKFSSTVVEEFMRTTQRRIGDPVLAALFENCYPNTLDTTVEPGSFEGKPDTVVITGDIAAMWLRDSSAQVWPYLPLAAKDPSLQRLLEGVIRRQTRCLLIDTYANAFMADLSAPPLPWSVHDKTEMKQGVGERKYELDSLCYPVRLAHGYWRRTGDTAPFDAAWHEAMRRVVQTMKVQQRATGENPYHFERMTETATDTLSNGGRGNPVKAVGLIASAFRPSDDACIFPFLVPSNLFAVTSLRQLAEMARALLHDDVLANEASELAGQVERGLRHYAIGQAAGGNIWAYEVDGFGGQVLMDDANVPSLLGLPYLESSPDAGLYGRTRSFVWSARNPWFFAGSAGEGIGGPHEGDGMIWPMSQIIYALTAGDGPGSGAEIRRALAMLKGAARATGFMHESYYKDDSSRFTRAWFAWANTLFGELVATLAASRPELLKA